jgi:hypothetical protein
MSDERTGSSAFHFLSRRVGDRRMNAIVRDRIAVVGSQPAAPRAGAGCYGCGARQTGAVRRTMRALTLGLRTLVFLVALAAAVTAPDLPALVPFHTPGGSTLALAALALLASTLAWGAAFGRLARAPAAAGLGCRRGLIAIGAFTLRHQALGPSRAPPWIELTASPPASPGRWLGAQAAAARLRAARWWRPPGCGSPMPAGPAACCRAFRHVSTR